MVHITVKGEKYPARLTLGAMRRFKAETGHELSDGQISVSEMAALLWCCVKSACNADGIAFDMLLDDFADNLEMEQLEQYTALMEESTPKKKTGVVNP